MEEGCAGLLISGAGSLPCSLPCRDEEGQGGCLASARGFVHISASGDMEPCPFAPFSDTNVLSMPLREALGSQFLGLMRASHSKFMETAGGCALWKNRDAVESLPRRRPG